MKTKILSLMLALLMCLSITAVMCGCSSEKPDTKASQATTQEVATEASDPLWESAVYNDDVTLGQGATAIDVEVKAGEKAVTITINTDAENLEQALLENELVAGEEGAYGLYIKTVNGILADYDVDQAYWAMYKDGEYLTTGANETIIVSGDHYELVYTK